MLLNLLFHVLTHAFRYGPAAGHNVDSCGLHHRAHHSRFSVCTLNELLHSGTALRAYVEGGTSAWSAPDMICLCLFAGVSLVVMARGISALLGHFWPTSATEECGYAKQPSEFVRRKQTRL